MTNFVQQSIEFLLKAGIKGEVCKEAKGPCQICGNYYSIMNSHHTVPQSCGGEKSLQVSLCPTHHDNLHAHALYVLSAKKDKSKKFWDSDLLEQRAEPLLNVLLLSLRLNKDSDEGRNRNLVTVNLSQLLKSGLKVLSKDVQLNQNKTLIYCLICTLQNQGVISDEEAKRQLAILRNMPLS